MKYRIITLMGTNSKKTRQGNFAAELHFGKCLIFIVFFALFFAACRNNTTCLPVNGGGGGSGGNPNPPIPACTHVWGDWVRTGPKDFIIPALPTVEFFTTQETTRTCTLCGVDDVFTPYPGTGGTISGGGTGGAVRYINPVVNMDMMWIPDGSFMMGSPGTEPMRQPNEVLQHITLSSGFYMSRTTVTRGQWRAVMGTLPAQETPWSGWPPVVNDNLAATHVNWYEAILFANRLSIDSNLTPVYEIQAYSGAVTVLPGEWSSNPVDWGTVPTGLGADATRWNQVRIAPGNPNGYRLPTEAQWEYAARAGTQTAFNDGVTDDFTTLTVGGLGWFSPGVAAGNVRLVGLTTPNAWGLYDMHGNVMEWAWDLFGLGRMLRGGSWSNPAHIMRSARLASQVPWHRGNAIGFRLVRLPS